MCIHIPYLHVYIYIIHVYIHTYHHAPNIERFIMKGKCSFENFPQWAPGLPIAVQKVRVVALHPIRCFMIAVGLAVIRPLATTSSSILLRTAVILLRSFHHIGRVYKCRECAGSRQNVKPVSSHSGQSLIMDDVVDHFRPCQ
jgi:hypothetical protein